MRRRFRDGLAYRESLSKGAPLGTLLFVHGLGESGLCFEGLLEEEKLEAFCRVAVDLPGYGASPWDHDPRSLTACAELLAGWLLPLESPVVVLGHSMGGVVAQLLLELPGPHHAQLRAFADVEGNLSPPDCTFSGPVAAQERGAFLANGYERLLERLYQDGARDLALRSYFVSCRLCDPRAYHRHSGELVEVSQREDLAQRLAALTLPKLYLHGSPRGTGARSLALLRDAGVPSIAIDGAGHWPFLDRHDAVVDALVAFLDSAVATITPPEAAGPYLAI
ncbi:MAG TPA: alpha/beta hydrolase [Thermoanaerobaculia bacterium]|nr:alpha/beta hydrolase [Thermoanaerobaculia bacterium]